MLLLVRPSRAKLLLLDRHLLAPHLAAHLLTRPILLTLLILPTTRSARTPRSVGGSPSRSARRLQWTPAGRSHMRLVLMFPSSGAGLSPRSIVRSTQRRNVGRPTKSTAGTSPGSTALRRRSRWPRSG